MAAAAVGTPAERFALYNRWRAVPKATRETIQRDSEPLSELVADAPNSDTALDTLLFEIDEEFIDSGFNRWDQLLDWVAATSKTTKRVMGGAADFGDEAFAALVGAFVAAGKNPGTTTMDDEMRELLLVCVRLIVVLSGVYARTIVGIRHAVIEDILATGLPPADQVPATATASQLYGAIDNLFSRFERPNGDEDEEEEPPGVYELVDMMDSLILECRRVQPGTEATTLYAWIKAIHLQRLRELAASVADKYPPPVLSDGRIIDPYGAWLGLAHATAPQLPPPPEPNDMVRNAGREQAKLFRPNRVVPRGGDDDDDDDTQRDPIDEAVTSARNSVSKLLVMLDDRSDGSLPPFDPTTSLHEKEDAFHAAFANVRVADLDEAIKKTIDGSNAYNLKALDMMFVADALYSFARSETLASTVAANSSDKPLLDNIRRTALTALAILEHVRIGWWYRRLRILHDKLPGMLVGAYTRVATAAHIANVTFDITANQDAVPVPPLVQDVASRLNVPIGRARQSLVGDDDTMEKPGLDALLDIIGVLTRDLLALLSDDTFTAALLRVADQFTPEAQLALQSELANVAYDVNGLLDEAIVLLPGLVSSSSPAPEVLVTVLRPSGGGGGGDDNDDGAGGGGDDNDDDAGVAVAADMPGNVFLWTRSKLRALVATQRATAAADVNWLVGLARLSARKLTLDETWRRYEPVGGGHGLSPSAILERERYEGRYALDSDVWPASLRAAVGAATAGRGDVDAILAAWRTDLVRPGATNGDECWRALCRHLVPLYRLLRAVAVASVVDACASSTVRFVPLPGGDEDRRLVVVFDTPSASAIVAPVLRDVVAAATYLADGAIFTLPDARVRCILDNDDGIGDGDPAQGGLPPPGRDGVDNVHGQYVANMHIFAGAGPSADVIDAPLYVPDGGGAMVSVSLAPRHPELQAPTMYVTAGQRHTATGQDLVAVQRIVHCPSVADIWRALRLAIVTAAQEETGGNEEEEEEEEEEDDAHRMRTILAVLLGGKRAALPLAWHVPLVDLAIYLFQTTAGVDPALAALGLPSADFLAALGRGDLTRALLGKRGSRDFYHVGA